MVGTIWGHACEQLGTTMATYFAATALVGFIVWAVLGFLLQDRL
jgi:hypothetical protein